MITDPVVLVLEAKTVGSRDPSFAIREAAGRVLEYRYFLGPRDAQVGILLDPRPGEHLVEYVEKALGMMIMWADDGGRFRGGAETATALAAIGIQP